MKIIKFKKKEKFKYKRKVVIKDLILNINSNDVQHVKPEELKKLVVRELNGTALTTDLDAIYTSIVSHPWIKDATVRRIWPNKILAKHVFGAQQTFAQHFLGPKKTFRSHIVKGRVDKFSDHHERILLEKPPQKRRNTLS